MGEVKASAPNAPSYKYKYGKVLSCTEYGAATIRMYTADHAECKHKKDFQQDPAAGKINPVTYSFAGTSMCQPYWMGVPVTNGPYPGISVSDPEKVIGSYKVNCNPNPADVCAICLGTLAIVFSFVAIGLAVVAKGK